ncbi:MAG: hypothetical protein JW936_00545 [Sedimentisphaerales bacterium]|nr:hypothetical protein [Sedimentisphaerales bacterium]
MIVIFAEMGDNVALMLFWGGLSMFVWGGGWWMRRAWPALQDWTDV